MSFTVEELGREADRFFPHRKEDGSPSYRVNQRETIVSILKAYMIDEKVFVALDGPVGSGKSAICYTVARVMKDAVYLTPQKQLQDQIAKEHWKGVKMVKGKSAYTCNYLGIEDNNIRCSYSGERLHMCNNSSNSYRHVNGTEGKVRKSIETVMDMYDHDERLFRMHTGFEPDDDLQREFRKIQSHVQELDEERGTVTKYPVPSAIGCVMGDCECPVKSSRVLAKMADLKLLNPDVFYNLNRTPIPLFGDNSLMIIDECHKMEDVIQRIFSSKLPLDTVKELFGIDMTELFNCETASDFSEKFLYIMKTYLGPMMAVAHTINRMGDTTKVTDYQSLQDVKTINEFGIAIKSAGTGVLQNRAANISILQIANHAFTDSKEPLPRYMQNYRDVVRACFLENCTKYGCEDKIDIYTDLVPACERYCNKVGWDRDINRDRQIGNHIINLKKALDSFMEKITQLISIKDGDYESFVIGKDPQAKTRQVCAGTEIESVVKDYYNFEHTDRVIEIVPSAVGALMWAFFYSKATTVLLSTGTWVDLRGMLRVFGVPEDKYEYIRIPSTFVSERRPVYVLSGKRYTDFSERERGVGYIYKTDAGTRKFCSELSYVLNSLRKHINDKHGENPNIIVHCHTFDIARRIAEFCPDVDRSFLIHLPTNSSPIRNHNTGWITDYIHKDELVQTFMTRQSSGLTLVSSSVSEGVDFKYGAARGQIILKRPTPYLGSPYVNAYYKGNADAGIQKDHNYLDRVTFTEITQIYGRVMRAEDDWGYTVVFDQALAKTMYVMLSNRNLKRLDDLNLQYFASGVQGGRDHRGMAFFHWPF